MLRKDFTLTIRMETNSTIAVAIFVFVPKQRIHEIVVTFVASHGIVRGQSGEHI
jgi:hypothetical protein